MERVHGCLILGVGEKVLSNLYHCFRSFSRAEKAICVEVLSTLRICCRGLKFPLGLCTGYLTTRVAASVHSSSPFDCTTYFLPLHSVIPQRLFSSLFIGIVGQ